MKTILFTTLFLLCSSIILSQGYQKQWDDLYSTTDSLSSFADDVDPNGNVFVVGSALSSFGNYELLFLKYDPSGNLLWNVKLNATSGANDFGVSVTCDNSGNSYWLCNVNQTNSFNSYVSVYKYDPNGNQVWSFQSSTLSNGFDIERDLSGNIIIGANKYVGFETEALLISLNENTGTQNWEQSYTITNQNSFIKNLIVSNQNEIYACGNSKYNTLGARGNYIFKTNGQGNLLWETFDTITNSFLNSSESFDVLSNGNLIVGSNFNLHETIGFSPYRTRMFKIDNTNGSIYSDTSFTFNNWNGEEFSHIKVSQSGNTYGVLTARYGIDRNNVSFQLNSADSLTYQQIYYAKSLNATGISLKGDTLACLLSGRLNGQSTFATVVYNSDGSEIWKKTFSNSYASSFGSAITFDAFGNIYIVGYGNVSFGQNQVLTLKLTSRDFIIPPDFYNDPISQSHLYYQNKGQLVDENRQITDATKYISNGAYPTIFSNDTALMFVEYDYDSTAVPSTITHRVDLKFLSDFASNLEVVSVNPVKAKQHYYNDYIPYGVENISGYERLVYQNVWNNIDAHLYSGPSGQKISFVMMPGSEPQNISLELNGQNAISIVDNGLVVETNYNGFGFEQAIAYQLTPQNTIIPINWQPTYTIDNNNRISFDNIGVYNPNLPLVFQLQNKNTSGSAKAANGNLLWSSYISHPTADANEVGEYMVDVDANRRFVVYMGNSTSLFFPSNNNTLTSNAGNIDVVLMELDVNSLEVEFSTFYGGPSDDWGTSVCINKALGGGFTNKIVFGGNTRIPAGSTVTVLFDNNPSYEHHTPTFVLNYSNEDPFIVRLNANGTLDWGTLVWSSYPQIVKLLDVEYDLQGNIYASGGFVKNGIGVGIWTSPFGGIGNNRILELSAQSTTQPSSSHGAGFIFKWDDNCQPIYKTDVAGLTVVRDMDTDPSGNLVFTGTVKSNPDPSYNFGLLFAMNEDPSFLQLPTLPPPSYTVPDNTGFVGLLDANNSLRFLQRFSANSPIGGIQIPSGVTIKGEKVAVISSLFNNVATKEYPGGYFQSDNQAPGGNNRDLFLMEIVSNHNAAQNTPVTVTWATHFGGTYAEEVFVSGFEIDEAYKSTVNYDANNNLIFTANVYAGTYQDPNPLDFPMPLAQPQDYYWNTNFQNTTGRGDDGVIFAVDQDKKLIWSTFWGGQFEDIIRGATVDYNGNRLFIAGETDNLNYLYPNAQYPYELNDFNVNSNNDYYNANGYSQAFGALFSLVDINIPLTNVGIENPLMNNNVAVFPNPSDNVVNIVANEHIENLQLYDTKGALIQARSTVYFQEATLDISSLSSGIYLLQITTDKGVYNHKIQKR